MTPVPTVTVTSCYPPQFYASALATISLPPFQQLVCPYKWQTINVNSTYRICCPDHYRCWPYADGHISAAILRTNMFQ
ncbi:uncharacterized protein TrAFT101_006668 [Trichoderma asperellum]|uniref:uncharacterized protein n=1 Tax=Trichoderma asperellum TaxID=101201 RepID=UPI0033336891|nr:hypothetical protein TrAFT101_006668 [Trichoderma asperellum]